MFIEGGKKTKHKFFSIFKSAARRGASRRVMALRCAALRCAPWHSRVPIRKSALARVVLTLDGDAAMLLRVKASAAPSKQQRGDFASEEEEEERPASVGKRKPKKTPLIFWSIASTRRQRPVDPPEEAELWSWISQGCAGESAAAAAELALCAKKKKYK